MATTVKIRLEGGPCDGQNATVQRSGALLPSHTCKGVNYQPTERVTVGGRVVYTTKASQQKPPPQADADGVKTARAHGAWHGLMRTVAVDAPKELQRAAKAREAIRQLRHRKGLR